MSFLNTFLSRHSVLLGLIDPGEDVEVGVDENATVACDEAGHVFGCH